MDCEEMRRMLAEEMEGWTERQQQEVDLHVRLCPDCRAYMDALRRIDGLLAEAPLICPPADFAERVAVRLDGRESRSRTWLGVATLSAVAIGGVAALLYIMGNGAANAWQNVNTSLLCNMGVRFLWHTVSLLDSALRMAYMLLRSLSLAIRQPQAAAVAAVVFMMTLLWTKAVMRLPAYQSRLP